MTDAWGDRPLLGTAVYNPGLLNQKELKTLFVARRKVLERMVDDLRRTGATGQPQHRLVVGTRGMGKTTLLHRLALAVTEEEGLNTIWLPLLFPEEQYSMACLGDFWLNCLDALGDILERQGDIQAMEQLDQQVDTLHRLPPAERARQGLAALETLADRKERRLLLLVDNVDMVLDRAKEEHWALREVLGHHPRLMLVGASAQILEVTHDYNAAFYDFFKVDELRGLTLEETGEVLLALDGLATVPTVKESRVSPAQQLVENDRPRLKALHLLTGGNPRTIVMLHGVLANGWGDGIRADLERLLDLCTPLYKARIESLPPQGQRVMDALATNWHPMTARQAAEATGLDINTASSQLNRLTREGLVEKTSLPDKRKTGFMVAERFFNIWYLMRASRRLRRHLAWLVEFLRMFYSQEELVQQAQHHIQRNRRDDPRWVEEGLARAQTLDRYSPVRHALESSAVHAIFSSPDLRRQLAPMLDLEGEDGHLKSQAERILLLEEAKAAVLAAPVGEWPGAPNPGEFWDLLGGSWVLSSGEKHKIAQGLTYLSKEMRNKLLKTLKNSEVRSRKIFRHEKRVNQIQLLIKQGVLDNDWNVAEVEGAITDAELRSLGEGQWLFVFALLGMAEKGASQDELLPHLDRARQIVEALSWGTAWLWLGNLLKDHLGRHEEAEAAFREAIRIDPAFALPWYNLGGLLTDRLGRHGEAEAAFREAIQIDPAFAPPWNNLGGLLKNHLGRHKEAEAAYREAIRINPANAIPWINLGNLLAVNLARHEEAEAAYREAIQLDPDDAFPWNGLAYMLTTRMGRHQEAEAAARKAVALQPDDPDYINTLAHTLVNQGRWHEAAPLIQRTWEVADDSFFEEHWGNILLLMRNTLAQGFGREAVALLDRTGMGQRWLPLRAAMNALAEGKPELLNGLAPEVRVPALGVLEQLRGK